MKLGKSCIAFLTFVSVLWVFCAVTYLGMLDGLPEVRTHLRYRGMEASTAADFLPPPPNVPLIVINNNDLPKQIREEQFSLNKIPEVDVEKLSVMRDAAEQVSIIFLEISQAIILEK